MKLHINRANLRWSIGSIGFGLTVGMISAAFPYGSDAGPILDVLLALTLFSSLIALGLTYLPTGDAAAHDVLEYEMLSIPKDEPEAIELPQGRVSCPLVETTSDAFPLYYHSPVVSSKEQNIALYARALRESLKNNSFHIRDDTPCTTYDDDQSKWEKLDYAHVWKEY